MQIPNEEEIKSLGYSQELIEGIIRPMINKNPIDRPTSQQINNIFMKYYVEKYVYNTGLYSSIVCLFSSPSLFNYFMNFNFNKQQMSQNPIFSKLYEIFSEIYNLNNMNMNNNIMINNTDKKSINHLIYDLRELLIKKGLKAEEKGNNEIDPMNIITFLLKKLHEELNIYKGKIGNLQTILLKGANSENPKSEAYKSYKKFYTSNFESIISQEFYGLIKTKTMCNICNGNKNSIKYDFNVLCYIPFNVKILVDMMKENDSLNLYYAFNCLNHNMIELDKRQFVQCEACKKATVHSELKQFYNLSKNLVIIFDRGENYINKNFIDFPEDFPLDYSYVEHFKNIKVNYKLNSIICRVEENQNDNKRAQEKFISFERVNGYDGTYISPSLNGQNQNKVYNLNQIKNFGLVMILFYYSDYGIPNFTEDLDNLENQINNMNINNLNNNIGNLNNFNNNINNNLNSNFNGNNMNINNINFNENINNNNNFNNNFNNNNFNGMNMNMNMNNNNNFNGMNNNPNAINNNFVNNNEFNFQFNPNVNQQQNCNNNQNFINMNGPNNFNQMNNNKNNNFNINHNNNINNINNNQNGFININNQNQQNNNFNINNFIPNNFNNENNNIQMFNNNNQIMFKPFSNNNNFNDDQTNFNNFNQNNNINNSQFN